MKKIFRIGILGIVLALLGASLLFLTACRHEEKSFDRTAEAYFDALLHWDYDAIYDLCAPQVTSRISRAKMVQQYETIYSTLKVTGLNVEQKARNEEEDRCVYEYILTLHSETYGDLVYDSSLEVLNKIGFYLLNWSPANIIAPMDWNDTIHYRTLRALRGEIFDCNNKVLVKNTYAVTVYANMLKIGELAQTAEQVSAVLVSLT